MATPSLSDQIVGIIVKHQGVAISLSDATRIAEEIAARLTVDPDVELSHGGSGDLIWIRGGEDRYFGRVYHLTHHGVLKISGALKINRRPT